MDILSVCFVFIADGKYWLGFVKQGEADKWTKMDLTTSLTWQAPIVDDSDDMVRFHYFKNEVLISI